MASGSAADRANSSNSFKRYLCGIGTMYNLFRPTIYNIANGRSTKVIIPKMELAASSTIQEVFQDFNVLFRLLICRQMAALLKEDELCAGDGVRQPPGRERGDVHVITAVDHQRRKLKAAEFGGEVKIGGRFGDGFANGWLIAEVAHVAHV